MTLGIPGDTMTAVLIGAFMIHGLTPGPLLFKNHPEVVSSVYVGILVGTVSFALIGLFGAPLFARVLKIPRCFLYPMIVALCIIGTFSINNSLFDVWVMIFFGLLSFFFRQVNLEAAPVILGFILGPIFEENLRRGLMISEGSLLPLVTRPICLVLLAIIVALFVSGIRHYRKHEPHHQEEKNEE